MQDPFDKYLSSLIGSIISSSKSHNRYSANQLWENGGPEPG